MSYDHRKTGHRENRERIPRSMINSYRWKDRYMKTDKKRTLRAKERKLEMLVDIRINYFPCLFVTASSYRPIFTLFIPVFFPHWQCKVFRKRGYDHVDKFIYRNSFCFIPNGHFLLSWNLKARDAKSSLHHSSSPIPKVLTTFLLKYLKWEWTHYFKLWLFEVFPSVKQNTSFLWLSLIRSQV